MLDKPDLNLIPFPQEEVDPTFVSLIEDLLLEVKSGEIRGIAIVATCLDGSVQELIKNPTPNLFSLIAGLEVVKQRLILGWVEMPEKPN